jgi:hypothetical protein
MMLAALIISAQATTQTPASLNWQTFESIKAHASLQGNDTIFQSLNWRTRIFDGLVDGQKADKPVLMWLYFGDPRGHC